jgi:hypothetical protein
MLTLTCHVLLNKSRLNMTRYRKLQISRNIFFRNACFFIYLVPIYLTFSSDEFFLLFSFALGIRLNYTIAEDLLKVEM